MLYTLSTNLIKLRLSHNFYNLFTGQGPLHIPPFGSFLVRWVIQVSHLIGAPASAFSAAHESTAFWRRPDLRLAWLVQ